MDMTERHEVPVSSEVLNTPKSNRRSGFPKADKSLLDIYYSLT